jgi:hypothetical protein
MGPRFSVKKTHLPEKSIDMSLDGIWSLQKVGTMFSPMVRIGRLKIER